MFIYSSFTLFVLCIYCGIDAASFIKKCKSDDSKCIKQSARAILPILAVGLPEYGIQPLDPFHLQYIDASIPQLKHILKNTTIIGLKDCNMKKIVRDKAKSKLFMQLLCSCKIEGHYEMSGRLLIFPIDGKGTMKVTLRKIEINFDGDLKQQAGKDGKDHWKIEKWHHSYELKDKSDVHYENLFKGSKVLSDAAKQMVSESGNDIINEVGPKIIKYIVETVISTVNQLFSAIPSEELSVD